MWSASLDFARFRHVYVLGAGKATALMAKAVEELLGNRITGGLHVGEVRLYGAAHSR
ncbi:MAG: DUF4147 domain-containing protein [Spirochaetota bacterium]